MRARPGAQPACPCSKRWLDEVEGGRRAYCADMCSTSWSSAAFHPSTNPMSACSATAAAVATIAIRDPLAYYDPVLKVSAAMLGPGVEKLNDRRPCEIELLTPAAIEFLTDWIVDTLILNQQQISSRRETMASPPRLL